MKLFIGNVVWRDVAVGHAQAMQALVRELDAQAIPYDDATVVGDALVSRARSRAATAFLASDADVLLTIDSDIWFQPEDAISLCEKALADGVVAALYLTRNGPQPALMLPAGMPIIFARGAPLVEVPFVSSGFMAISRQVMEGVIQSLPWCDFWPCYMPFVSDYNGKNVYLSEDWAFCQRAREAGYHVWLDPGVRLGHVGTTLLTLEELLRTQRPEVGPLQMLRDEDGTLHIDALELKKVNT